MKTKIFKLTGIIFISAFLFSFDLPTGWNKAGTVKDSYEMGIDKGSGVDGSNSAIIKSKQDDLQGFGTLMQNCSPGKYLGKKIKMTGFVKSENLKEWAGLWLRVDQTGSTEPISFDNMYDRPITGTTGWTKYEIILNVPANASNLAFGALLDGAGQIWFDNITFEVIGNSDIQAEPSKTQSNAVKIEQINLDFEE